MTGHMQKIIFGNFCFDREGERNSRKNEFPISLVEIASDLVFRFWFHYFSMVHWCLPETERSTTNCCKRHALMAQYNSRVLLCYQLTSSIMIGILPKIGLRGRKDEERKGHKKGWWCVRIVGRNWETHNPECGVACLLQTHSEGCGSAGGSSHKLSIGNATYNLQLP